MKARWMTLFLPAALLLLLGSGCGSDSSDDNNASDTVASNLPQVGRVSIALSPDACGIGIVRAASFMGITLTSPNDTVNTTLGVGTYTVTGTILNTETGLSNQLQTEFQIMQDALTTIRLDCSGFSQL